jgi:hypothetical protein
MDLCHLKGATLRRTLSTSPKPHPHNYGRLTQSELLIAGACVLIGLKLIWRGRGKADEI